MQLAMQVSQCAPARQARLARPVALSCSTSAYLGRRILPSRTLGMPQLPARRAARRGAAQVRASFLGVGAPEAILVGVVALLVFGPKGLAQAAKSLGATLRSFAPTIREITSVSQELKSTLEQEIGINEIKEELTRPAVPTPRPASPSGTDDGAALSELADSMAASRPGPADAAAAAAIDPEIERKRAEAAAAAWGGAAPAAAAAAAAAPAAAAAAPAAASAATPAAPAAPAAAGKPRAVEAMSLDELEAELAKRKAAATAGSNVPQQLSATDDA
ncbi:Sec-independent translocase chloroplastic [Chlorella sorokiniana]|uniref:Sec-independent translocase chloroplastic n=1 Tax=Chlorella sorokiniana TaxID=3076 RepID=A0A2P6TII6_CHLSO|nr:Sec-independent translocase chloroplastic [Chlorella sorokiniana]|eukprot:PRW34100.1 Sec-independent translocase chloroplastic [Chlorella sorokiniana]